MDLEDLFERRRHGDRHEAGDHHRDRAGEIQHGRHDAAHCSRSGVHVDDEDHAPAHHHGHDPLGAVLASPWVGVLRTSRAAQLGLVTVAVVLLALLTTALWGVLGYLRARGLQGLVEGVLRTGETLWKGSGGR